MPPEWLTQSDERILEFLDSESKATPMEMADSGLISASNSYISQRLQLLLEIELVERVAHGQYRITPKGHAFVAGQEDLRDLDKPE